LHRFASAELDWLVQVDDDSSVCVPNLLATLSGYNPKHSLHLGDFVKAWHNSTHWMRPYSCGGAGTVFSRGAVLTTSFAACTHIFESTCLQSDWMIGRCASLHGVLPVIKAGCGCSAMGHDDRSVEESLRESNATGTVSGYHKCAFMHVDKKERKARFWRHQNLQVWGSYVHQHNAILHATPPTTRWSSFHHAVEH
jgi:hypothetical protein